MAADRLGSAGCACCVCGTWAHTGSLSTPSMPPERSRRPAAGCQAVLVGSSSLALWDVPRQARVAKLTGHTARAPRARRRAHARVCMLAMRWMST